MRRMIPLFLLLTALAQPARADFWGGDLPLLAKIVANTLSTLDELRTQTGILSDSMDGINDRIYRIQTISEIVQPSSWDQWRDPQEAMRRLKLVYHTLPPEYRSAKSDAIEEEISKAMNLVSRVAPEVHTSFQSGKELERRGADASPGVATKLTASGVGTLVSMGAQSLAIQSHITTLLAQMLAEANERESREVVTRAAGFSGVSTNLGKNKGWFSNHVSPMWWLP